ncbi:KAP family P-loop domain-containing protein [Hathewaya proteolytica DSM 3090]|uniref:KAP family P-loop domain-containing protein n=1 Tax=Hathewaya proteolytica DSM 3090 TaxID=1121331 RepID=A0A1M6KFS8_9CLOT|nr:Qat anti-phage system ATPase QatA [Hathewaya proteolytica]SHJ57717.1 KAP family P-loop domain-containing protein [Hathewaya proteolytica DSM 3090]
MILSDNETRIDRFNNMAIAKTIVSIIKENNESISIGVHGDWGAGKSSVLAMVEDEIKKTSDTGENGVEDDVSDYCVIRFNSWQYQGFEDAKIALMRAIVCQLEEVAKVYLKHHPIENGIKEIKDIGKRLWKNLDKLSMAKNMGKIGVSLATGTAPLAIMEGIISTIKGGVTDEEKASNAIEKIGSLIDDSKEETSGYSEMEDFRKNFKELFEKAHIKKIVVLIDDLDRCLPKVAIETLEAVRIFLTLENTAFIIAADDAMIRYSVKEYFPRVIEEQNDKQDSITKKEYNNFADKYLEKLIQVPLHIPRIGIAEAQLYIMLLMIESELGETKELKELNNEVISKLHKPWALEQLSTEEIKNSLSEKYYEAIENVKIAKNIDKILAEHTGGNPRNIKRFINMLLLRTEIARNRGFDPSELKMGILAKMMLIEQYNNDFYKALADELDEEGHCKAFNSISDIETDGAKIDDKEKEEGKNVKIKKEIKKVDKLIDKEDKSSIIVRNEQFIVFLQQDDIKKWMQIEPSLVDIDLRPYYFACTERIDFFFSSSEERLRELVSVVRAGTFSTSSKKEEIIALNFSGAKKLFNIVSQDVFIRDLSDNKPPRSVEGIRCLVEYRPELQDNLVNFLLTLPFNKLGIWAVGGWDSCIPKTSSVRGELNLFFKKVEESTTDLIIKNAAKGAQR